MDIYAKIKYNKPEDLIGAVNTAFHQEAHVKYGIYPIDNEWDNRAM